MQIGMISKLSSLLRTKQRKSDRRRRTLPVSVLGVNAKAATRDISFSGVYFETGTRLEVGSAIKMTIDLESLERMQLECEGIIVRVEKNGSKAGVAVRFNSKTTVLATKQ
jgi:hypothetical protein